MIVRALFPTRSNDPFVMIMVAGILYTENFAASVAIHRIFFLKKQNN